MIENQIITIDAASRLLRVSIPKARRLLRGLRVGAGLDAGYRTGDVLRVAREREREVNAAPLPVERPPEGRGRG